MRTVLTVEQAAESGQTESCETCEPDTVDSSIGVVSALLASSCCWIPALAATAGFSAVGIGVVMMQYHTPLAILALGLLALAWYLFLRKRVNKDLPWNSGYVQWGVLLGSSVVVLLYSVIGWVFPSVLIYLM